MCEHPIEQRWQYNGWWMCCLCCAKFWGDKHDKERSSKDLYALVKDLTVAVVEMLDKAKREEDGTIP